MLVLGSMIFNLGNETRESPLEDSFFIVKVLTHALSGIPDEALIRKDTKAMQFSE